MGKEQIHLKTIAQNKKAFHDYFVEESFEAGIELCGTEVKSVRSGKINLKDSWCSIVDGELLVNGMHILSLIHIYIITSRFEHHAVLHTVEALAKQGFSVTYLDVHHDGIIRPEELEAAIREDTALVSIMYANNEIGTIQPIAELGAICKRHKVLFHTDAVQAVGNVSIDVQQQNIDLLSLSGHKLHGPKGTGALYIRRGIQIQNLIEGGAQERGRRAGTENTAGIVGLGVAVEDALSLIHI